MKFEPSLQLKTRTTPGNQESFATRPTSSPTEAEKAEYHASLQALMQDEIVELDVLEKKNTKLHYNSEQSLINLLAIVGCLNLIALRARPDIAWATSRAARLITHDPDACFIRVKHICQYLRHTLGCDMFQYLLRPSTNCGYWEMPPLLRQGSRVNKDWLCTMVSPRIRRKVVTSSNRDRVVKTSLPSPLVKQNW